MTSGKKMTYANLSVDETFHAQYEKVVDQLSSTFYQSHPLHIGDQEIYSAPEFTVHSPFDSAIVVGRFQTASPAFIRLAITTAKKEFPAWSGRDWHERVAILKKAAAILNRQKFPLSALVTFESGKNRAEAMAEVSEAIDMIRYHAEIYTKNRGFVTPMRPESESSESKSVMKPYGTWAVISPFNFPISLAAGMAAAALICGNTIILKPTSAAPFSVLKLYEAFIAAGVPADAVHYLTGPGGTFGDIITAHPDVDGIAFTGSRDAGVWLQRSFTERQPCPKPVVAEMGSKNPVIVTSHADLKKAVDGITKAAFGYGGQKCSATSRVYVHSLVFDAFTEMLKTRARSLVVGDPRVRETDVGPVIDAKAVETFRDAVERIHRDGGKIITGGAVLSGDKYARGHFVQPTIVTGLKNGHPLIKKELFVPLVIVEPFESLEDALRMANDTDFGLTAGIFSENEEEIQYFFNHIQFGVTYANRRAGATTGAWPGSQSFCGWKSSGFSGRGIGGPWYLLSYMREQAQTRVK